MICNFTLLYSNTSVETLQYDICAVDLLKYGFTKPQDEFSQQRDIALILEIAAYHSCWKCLVFFHKDFLDDIHIHSAKHWTWAHKFPKQNPNNHEGRWKPQIPCTQLLASIRMVIICMRIMIVTTYLPPWEKVCFILTDNKFRPNYQHLHCLMIIHCSVKRPLWQWSLKSALKRDLGSIQSYCVKFDDCRWSGLYSIKFMECRIHAETNSHTFLDQNHMIMPWLHSDLILQKYVTKSQIDDLQHLCSLNSNFLVVCSSHIID